VTLEILRVLVDAGANPCATTPRDTTGRSAVAFAAEQNDAGAVTALLQSYAAFLKRTRISRRRDPVLFEQPESFFAGIESREQAERTVSLRDALVTSLFGTTSPTKRGHTCSLALYKSGARLGTVGLARLQTYLKRRTTRNPVAEFECASNDTCFYEARASEISKTR
jgi:hypothetical protein